MRIAIRTKEENEVLLNKLKKLSEQVYMKRLTILKEKTDNNIK